MSVTTTLSAEESQTFLVDREEHGASGAEEGEIVEGDDLVKDEEVVVARQETVQDEAICPGQPCPTEPSVSPQEQLMWTETVLGPPHVDPQGEEDREEEDTIRIRDLFQPLALLGKGGYGKVVLARKAGGPDTGRLYAVKAMKKGRVYRSTSTVQRIWLENKIMGYLQHPFLVSMNYALQSSTTLFLAMEFVQGGDFNSIVDTVDLQEQHVKFYAAEITLALEFLHRRCIIYRDLKAENTMLDSRGHIKLTDFGMAKRLRHPTDKTRSFCGTVSYMAPEIVRGQMYGKEVDWWSLGILIYFILTGEMMFEGRNMKDTQRLIRNRSPKFSGADISRVCQSFLRQLLHKNPDRRLGRNINGGAYVKGHPFFNGINWETLYQRLSPPPFIPDLNGKEDVSCFESTFTDKKLEDTVPTHSVAHIYNGFDGRYFHDFDFVREDV